MPFARGISQNKSYINGTEIAGGGHPDNVGILINSLDIRGGQ